MQETQYRSHPALSHSQLKEMSKSPAHFRYSVDNPPEETEDMLRGTLIHAMALEPSEVASRFVQSEPIDRRTKEGKAAWAKMQEETVGRTPIPSAMWALAERCVEAMERDVETSMWLNEARAGRIEVPLFWERQGVACKGRPDSVLADGTVVDIKTTALPLTPGLFVNEIFRRCYHTQAAFYRSGLLANGGAWRSHVLIGVETKPPYAVGAFRMAFNVIGAADVKVAEWIEIYRACLATNEWPGYGLTEVATPRWALAEAE